ncbi:terpene synthase family protein [Nocardia thraciensis]
MTNINDELGAHSTATPGVPTAVRIPMIEDGFVRRWHRGRWDVRRTCKQWMAEQGLLSASVADSYADDLLGYTDLVSGYYVGASADVVQAIADFSVWFFCWDDRHSVYARHRTDDAWWELSATLRRAVEQPARYVSHTEPLSAAFAESVGRLYGRLGPRWDARFAGHMAGVFDAYDREYRNLAGGVVPTVTEYLQLRRWTFGHDVWIDLLELTAGRELPSAVRSHRVYQRAAHASQEFASSYNDLCSLPKELSAGDIHNLGICLMHHDGRSVAAAQRAVRDHVIDCVHRFVAAETELRSLWGPADWPLTVLAAVESCVSNMRNWISSTYWFHHESGRYRMQKWADPAWPPYIDTGGAR